MFEELPDNSPVRTLAICFGIAVVFGVLSYVVGWTQDGYEAQHEAQNASALILEAKYVHGVLCPDEENSHGMLFVGFSVDKQPGDYAEEQIQRILKEKPECQPFYAELLQKGSNHPRTTELYTLPRASWKDILIQLAEFETKEFGQLVKVDYSDMKEWNTTKVLKPGLSSVLGIAGNRCFEEDVIVWKPTFIGESAIPDLDCKNETDKNCTRFSIVSIVNFHANMTLELAGGGYIKQNRCKKLPSDLPIGMMQINKEFLE